MKLQVILLFSVMMIPVMLGAQGIKWLKKGLNENNPNKKIEYFTKSIEKSEAPAVAYFDRRNVKYELKDYQGALSDYSKAITINLKRCFDLLYSWEFKFNLKITREP